MGNCAKGQGVDPPTQNPNKQPQIQSGAGKDRLTDNDKTILDIKGRMRKIKTYDKKLEKQAEDAVAKIKELIAAG